MTTRIDHYALYTRIQSSERWYDETVIFYLLFPKLFGTFPSTKMEKEKMSNNNYNIQNFPEKKKQFTFAFPKKKIKSNAE